MNEKWKKEAEELKKKIQSTVEFKAKSMAVPMAERYIAMGRCAKCGGEKELGYRHCVKCASAHREYNRRRHGWKRRYENANGYLRTE